MEGELATRGERFVGAFVDGIIMMPIVLPLSFGIGMATALVDTGMNPWLVEQAVAILGTLAGLVVYVAVNGYFLAHRGQSLGKMIVKTRIASEETGEVLPLERLILLRYLPLYAVSSILIVGSIVSLADSLAIFRGNRKCLHDEIAGTKVIKLSPSK